MSTANSAIRRETRAQRDAATSHADELRELSTPRIFGTRVRIRDATTPEKSP